MEDRDKDGTEAKVRGKRNLKRKRGGERDQDPTSTRDDQERVGRRLGLGEREEQCSVSGRIRKGQGGGL